MNLDLFSLTLGIFQHLNDALHQQQMDMINLRRENDSLRRELWDVKGNQKDAAETVSAAQEDKP